MKNIPSFSKIVAFVVIVLASNWVVAQDGTPIAFGQCKDSTLATASSTITYQTPFLYPRDVLLIRAKGSGVRYKFELLSPNGTIVATMSSTSTADLLQTTYTVPQTGPAGTYNIIVSATGSFGGNFSIAIEKMNEPANAVFLECNASLDGSLNCGPIIKTYRFLVQEGSRSRIKVVPSGTAPEVWLCDKTGNILSHESGSLGNIITFDTVLASQTDCYFLFVASSNGFFFNQFSVSHTLLLGDCIAPSVQTLPSNGNVCQGSPFSLTVSSPLPNATYIWSGPNGFTSTQAHISFPEALNSLSGIYTVNVTIPGVCPVVLTRVITVKPLPDPTAAVMPENGSVCQGESFKLSATPSSLISYKWTGPNNYTSTQQSPTLYNTIPEQSGFYNISVMDGNGCVGTDSVDVSVNALPSANIISPPTGNACFGQTLQLDVDTDAQDPIFSWSGPLFCGFTSNLQNPQIPNISFDCFGVYYVTVTDISTGCSNTTNKHVAINSLPLASISGGTVPLCKGASTTLTGCCSAQTYLWSTGDTTKNITVMPEATTKYYLTITDANGCMGLDSTVVQVKPLPSISVMSTPENPEICSGQGQILLSVMSPDAYSPIWNWTKNGAFISNNQVISLSNPGQSGIYTASVTDGMTHCSNTALTDTVNIYQTPSVSILQIPEPPYCTGDDLTFCAISDGTGPSYTWTNPAGPWETTLCAFLNNVNVWQSGVYSVTVTDVHGCMGSKAANVLINPQPMASISGDLAICEGSSTVLTASGGGSYSWSTLSSGASITVAPAVTTTYEVTVTNNFFCTDTANATVEVSVTDLDLSVVFDNGNIEASASGGQQPYSYSIFPFAPESPNQPGLFENVPGGTYTVIVTDAFGCTASNAINKTVDPIIAWGLTIAPNPSDGIAQIRTDQPFSGKLEMVLFDANGRRIRSFWMETPMLTLDLTDLANGFYILRISDGEKAGAMRLAVIR